MKRALWLSLLLTMGSLYARETLVYPVEAPIQQSLELEMKMSRNIPGMPFKTEGRQKVQMTVRIPGGEEALVPSPRELVLTLKNLEISLENNGQPITFHAGEPGSTLYLSQTSKIMDRPIRVALDGKGGLELENSELTALVNELPVMRQVGAGRFLEELIEPLFVLQDVELAEGVKGKKGKISYEITAVDDTEVSASLSGVIEPKLKLLKKGEDGVSLSVTGSIQGEGTWSRNNPLCHSCTLEYELNGTFKRGEKEWMMTTYVSVASKGEALR